MIKLVIESGGQQQIDPVDTELFNWATRVATTKTEGAQRQEVYAGLLYERMGGVFKLHDVLSESKLTERSAKYYDIEAALDKYSDSPSATKFLMSVIERSSPDAFHELDIQKARQLKAQDIKKHGGS